MSVELSSKDTVQIIKTESGYNNEMDFKTILITIFAATASVISVIALIISLVAVGKDSSNEVYIQTAGTSNGNTTSEDTQQPQPQDTTGTIDGEKIWMLQIGHFQSNTQYLDEASGTIQGYNVDVVNAVCQLANKNCELVWDVYENCWDSQVGERPRGGTGIMGRWYDACVGWIITSDRSRTLKFTNEFEKKVDVALWVNSGGRNLTTSANGMPDLTNLIVGFVDGWFSDEHCLARYMLQGFNQLERTRIIHYPNEASLIVAMNNGEIDTAFLSVRPSRTSSESGITAGWIPTDNKCLLGGIAIMTQKDQLDFVTWWNYGFDRLRVTSQYKDICRRLETDHGDQPGFKADDVCV